MVASLAVPTASTIRAFEVSALVDWRRSLKARGISVPIAGIIAAAVVEVAHQQVPAIRRRIEASDAGWFLVEDAVVNLGVAVDVASRHGHSVMVPVLKDAAGMSFPMLLERLGELAEACRLGTVSVSDLQAANLVLTSTGKFGSTTGIPRLPTGPGAIIAAGSIGVPAGMERLARTQQVDPVLTLSSTYDHRVIQGADSGKFLGAVEMLLRSEDFLTRLEKELIAEVLPGAPAADGQPVNTKGGTTEGVVRIAEFDTWASGQAARLEPTRARREGSWLPDGLEVEFAHIADPDKRAWFQRWVSGEGETPAPSRRRQALRLAAEIEVFEKFLQTQFLGQKTLSVEGLEATVIALAEIAGMSADQSASDIVIGMAHRGRLSIMAHVLEWPAERVLAEFLPTAKPSKSAPTGDVRQHLGGLGRFHDSDGGAINVRLEENPSHLEFVSPVALGAARSLQDQGVARGYERAFSQQRVVPVLLHGDAAFTGQGVVYETFNLQALDAYHVGGSIHIVQDNRLGFTATPAQLRSNAWPSDVVRGFGVPVLHTDADDLDANLLAARLAIQYRNAFAADIVIHVQGYRRHGHNESDEPRYTQPVYYADIASHRPVHALYDERLQKLGVVEPGETERDRLQAKQRLVDALEQANREGNRPTAASVPVTTPPGRRPREASPEWCAEVLDLAEDDRPDFAVHPKLQSQFRKRRELRGVDQRVDWGQAELLALKLINEAGVPLRLTGEDVERGTFSHRHLVVHDAISGAKANRLTFSGAPFLVANSPLSEVSTVGFEYGYGRTDPRAVQIWEAQFGDFVNVAQVIFDQFVMAGRDKWGRDGRLVVLLPHGWEGAGPEHSSARVERFLQMAARGNVRILVPTNASQYFSALVTAATADTPLPSIVLTPKSLLRAEAAKSPVEDFAPTTFKPLLASGASSEETRRLVLCSGKVGVEVGRLLGDGVRLVRIEQLYPFPLEGVVGELAAARVLEEVVWLQEEPENMGAWRHVSNQLVRSAPGLTKLGYVGRPESASPAEGYGADHKAAQNRLLEAAVRAGEADFWLPGWTR